MNTCKEICEKREMRMVKKFIRYSSTCKNKNCRLVFVENEV